MIMTLETAKRPSELIWSAYEAAIFVLPEESRKINTAYGKAAAKRMRGDVDFSAEEFERLRVEREADPFIKAVECISNYWFETHKQECIDADRARKRKAAV